MAIMMPAEQGKLGFEDRQLAYFPRFPAWGRDHPSPRPEAIGYELPSLGAEPVRSDASQYVQMPLAHAYV